MSNNNKKMIVGDVKKSFSGATALKPEPPKIKPQPKPQEDGSKKRD
ncbi:hypothetical protein [Vibrio cortegadensis]